MKLYYHPASTTSRIVMLCVAEEKIDVEYQVVDLFTGEHMKPPYAEKNPSCLVPMIEDGDFRMTESSTIIKYLAEKELQSLGAINIKSAYRDLSFTANKRALYNINFHCRLINRVLALLITFDCHSDNYLHKTVMKLPWQVFLNPERRFAIFASVSHSQITHSKYAALRFKDAIVDAFKSRDGKRPSVDTQNPGRSRNHSGDSQSHREEHR